MLTMFEARSPRGEMLAFPLVDTSSGIFVKDIEGLDPVKANIVTSSFARQDGVQYQTARRLQRDLNIKLGLEPQFGGGTVRDIRNRLYSFFMPKMPVALRFYTSDDLYVDILGRVEDCSAPMFTNDPEVVVSIACFDPDFVNPVAVEHTGATTSGLENTVFTYTGSVETGVIFSMENVPRAITEFTIYHQPPSEDIRTLEFSEPLQIGDSIYISTIPGSKTATIVRDSVEIPVVYGVSPYSNWIEMMPGDNQFRVYSEGTAVPYKITYQPRYGAL